MTDHTTTTRPATTGAAWQTLLELGVFAGWFAFWIFAALAAIDGSAWLPYATTAGVGIIAGRAGQLLDLIRAR